MAERSPLSQRIPQPWSVGMRLVLPSPQSLNVCASSVMSDRGSSDARS
ncbi:MAG: hypothetical protein ACFB0E_01200 [Leptolyngbyaceae cyanobacterium]